MAECPVCGAENDIENVAPGVSVVCEDCGAKLEVIKEGKRKALLDTDVEY